MDLRLFSTLIQVEIASWEDGSAAETQKLEDAFTQAGPSSHEWSRPYTQWLAVSSWVAGGKPYFPALLCDPGLVIVPLQATPEKGEWFRGELLWWSNKIMWIIMLL